MKRIITYLGDKLEKLRIKKEQIMLDREDAERKKQEEAEAKKRIEIEISTKSIFKILGIVVLFLVLKEIFIQLSGVITTTIICFFFTLGLAPICRSLEKRKIPRALAILFIYIAFIGALTVLFFSVIPVVIEQAQGPIEKISNYFGVDILSSDFFQKIQLWETVGEKGSLTLKNIPELFGKTQDLLGSTISIVGNIFEGIINFIFGLVLLFFMLLERERLSGAVLAFFPEKDREYIQKKTERIQEKLKKWFQGQIILMLAVGIFMYIGMKIFEYTLGMQYAGTVAILAGFMELFPYIGITISSILACLIAVNISWTLVLAIGIWIVLTQFLEGNLLVPVVMEKETGLSSVTVMLALAIGGTIGTAIGGIPLAILGMILAIPVGASVAIFVEEYISKKNSKI